MVTPERAADYLGEAERYAGRRFERRADLMKLLSAARDPDGAKLFDELLFLSKFSDRAIGIIRRTGTESDEAAKLTAELASTTARISELVGRLLGAGGEGGGGSADVAIPVSDHASFARLRVLIGELAVLKNFELHSEGK